MNKKSRIHVMPHTHWDQEWYFTISRAQVYLVNQIKEMIEMLEENPKYTYYLLDAQTSLVDDYLKYHPEDETVLRKLISDKRVLIGPWHTQSDQMVISAENVVRNLEYGIQKAKEYGNSMMLGYAPDIFGQNGNMPQIYKSFGINDVLFRRGLSRNTCKNVEFMWEGNDGTQVFAVQLFQGYNLGGCIPEDDCDVVKDMDKLCNPLESVSSNKIIPLLQGFDQSPVRRNLVDLIEKYNKVDSKREYILSSPELFAKDSRANINLEDLEVAYGELTEGKESRVHKSINSARADIKIANNQLENYLVNTVEPLLLMLKELGNRYPRKMMDEIWDLMFRNAAHDSIGTCNSDETNADVLHRYKRVRELATNLIDNQIRIYSEKVKRMGEIQFLVFNPLPYSISKYQDVTIYTDTTDFDVMDVKGNKADFTIISCDDVSEYVLKQYHAINTSSKVYTPKQVYKTTIRLYVKDLVSFGYTTYYLSESTKDHTLKTVDTNEISNDYYSVSINKDGTLNIYDKVAQHKYENQLYFEENGDGGDSYNYSPPHKDMIIDSRTQKITNVTVLNSEQVSLIRYTVEMEVPFDLESRAKGLCDDKLVLECEVSLSKNEKLIGYKLEVDNKVESHRLCIILDSALTNTVSIADGHFGTVKKPVILPGIDNWVEEKYDEIPNCIEAMQNYVSINSSVGAIGFMTEGVREYEVIGDNFDKLRLTLFRTYGYMGKDDIVYRPGRASGESVVATPDAQLLKKLKFEFNVFSYVGEFDDHDIAKQAKEKFTTLVARQDSDFLNGRLIYTRCFIDRTVENEKSLLSENIEGLVLSSLRYNPFTNKNEIRWFNGYLNKEVSIDKNIELFDLCYNTIENNQNITHNKFISYIIKK